MDFKPASDISVLLFVGIILAVITAFLAAVHYAYRGEDRAGLRRSQLMRTALAIAAWLGLLMWLVGSTALQHLPFFGIPFFFGAVFIVSTAVGLSRLGGKLATELPIAALVGFQSFRLPLELVLHAWGENGTIPLTMTWSGQNWDIVSGLVALLAAPFAGHSHRAAWASNLIGAILLLNVVRVAVMSSPLPIGWDVSPPLLLALHLPYALIGPVCVGGALIGHIVLTRALLIQSGHHRG